MVVLNVLNGNISLISILPHSACSYLHQH